MATIVTRAGKGSPLTNAEVDANFTNLNNELAGAGTVLSVALTLPAFLNVSGSPITSSGTFDVTLANQTPNQFFAGPASPGSPGQPGFRALVTADMPATISVTNVTGTTINATNLNSSGGTINLNTSSGGNATLCSTQTAGTLIVGGSSQTGAITLGRSTVSHTVNLHSGATSSGNTKTLNIGAGGLSGSTTNIEIGASSGTTNVTANGSWTFGSTISGSISGNAATVTDGVYTTGSYSDPSWITSLAESKVLPSQSGQSGKYLQTNGTSTSWVTLDLSSKANTDGSNATGTWGISITGNAATVTNGVYTTGTQTIAGNKTFSDTVAFQDSQHFIALTSGNAIHNLDSNDYWNFARSTNVLTWVVGGVARLTTDGSGNFTAAGTITANSDERLKKDWSDLPQDFVERLAEVKTGTYTMIDSGNRQIGVSAQSLRPVSPEGVLAGEYLSVAYGNVALAACVKLAQRVIELERKLAITNENIANVRAQ